MPKFSEGELDMICSKGMLMNQAHMNMQVRAAEISGLTGKQITGRELRELYRGRGITQQFARVRLGAAYPEDREK